MRIIVQWRYFLTPNYLKAFHTSGYKYPNSKRVCGWRANFKQASQDAFLMTCASKHHATEHCLRGRNPSSNMHWTRPRFFGFSLCYLYWFSLQPRNLTIYFMIWMISQISSRQKLRFIIVALETFSKNTCRVSNSCNHVGKMPERFA